MVKLKLSKIKVNFDIMVTLEWPLICKKKKKERKKKSGVCLPLVKHTDSHLHFCREINMKICYL